MRNLFTPWRYAYISGGQRGRGCIFCRIRDSRDDAGNLVVKRGGKAEETHENLSTKKGKQNAVTVVNAASKLIRLEEATSGALERPAKGNVRPRREISNGAPA